MASFVVDLSRITKEYADRLDTIVRKVAFDLFGRVIMRSPVDTGRFRQNWQLGINQQPTGVLAGTDQGSVNQSGIGNSEAKERVGADLASAKGGDIIYLINNLSYAERLEEGYSPQATGGVVAVSVAEFEGIVNKIGGEIRKT